jgi:hypothetical protein
VKWLLLAKPWLIPTLALLVGAAVGGSWWHGYQTGQKVAHSDQQAALEDLRERAAVLADELEAEKQRERIVYRDRIRTVYGEPDPSGCADVRVPAGVLSAIRGATGQPADGAVREAAPDGRNE